MRTSSSLDLLWAGTEDQLGGFLDKSLISNMLSGCQAEWSSLALESCAFMHVLKSQIEPNSND